MTRAQALRIAALPREQALAGFAMLLEWLVDGEFGAVAKLRPSGEGDEELEAVKLVPAGTEEAEIDKFPDGVAELMAALGARAMIEDSVVRSSGPDSAVGIDGVGFDAEDIAHKIMDVVHEAKARCAAGFVNSLSKEGKL